MQSSLCQRKRCFSRCKVWQEREPDRASCRYLNVHANTDGRESTRTISMVSEAKMDFVTAQVLTESDRRADRPPLGKYLYKVAGLVPSLSATSATVITGSASSAFAAA
jgi:hypothetical protein